MTKHDNPAKLSRRAVLMGGGALVVSIGAPVGLEMLTGMNQAFAQVTTQYGPLTWAKLAKPEYASPESIPVLVQIVNQLIMGSGGTPTIPLFIGQGANGELESTPGNKPGIGAGDGVMIAGDVRTLARRYCAKGTRVHYEQYGALSHISSIPIWLPNSVAWIKERFAGLPAPENCSSIAPGNSLAPIPVP